MRPTGASGERDALLATPIRDLGLTIEGSRLEPPIAAFRRELERADITRLRPHFYLSNEWGVPFGSVSIAVPFYLARADLIALHAEETGFLEGAGRGDLLRYLRHEMGHVVNYAYRLYDREDWAARFGPMGAEYKEEYRPEPFSPRSVCHLPGWYAQKHPDEDWAESFAVWMTPGYDWRAAYAGWPEALAKVEYCDRVMRELNARDPDVTDVDLDEDVRDMTLTLRQFYDGGAPGEVRDDGPVLAPALDASVRGIFEDLGEREDASSAAPRRPAGDLVRRLEQSLLSHVYLWTGCLPERVRDVVRQLAGRADALRQVYPADRAEEAVTAVTSLVTALSLSHVLRRD